MVPPKPIDWENPLKAAISTVTLRTLAQAAGLANLLVATFVFIGFSAVTLIKRDGGDFVTGLYWLIPALTLVIWGTATVMGVVVLFPIWLCTLVQWVIRRPARSSRSETSGLWDDWLDGT